jgi:hypothetical protein
LTVKSLRLALVLGAAALGVVVSARWGLRAQDDARKESEPVGVSVQEALQRPFIMPFGAPTTLRDVCRHLRMFLKAPVVLDLAALDRQELTDESTVQLDLHGVRLKTGLKLLLDQVRLTYKVVPEDNLLIVTDRIGSDDPLDRIESELKELHRDLHDVQDSVDEIRAALGVDEDDGMRVRKPTIIEELPNEKDMEKGKEPGKAKEPGKKESGPPPASSSARTRPGA